MDTSKTLDQQFFSGERALFHSDGLTVTNSVFGDGESPLKESRNLSLSHCIFQWKYPLWYCQHVTVKDSMWAEMARAGVWYTNDISVTDSVIEAPKNFRRCRRLSMKNVSLPHAAETLWSCQDVTMEHVTAAGDYFAMNSENMTISDFVLDGNYSFDGAKNVVIRNARMLSKDAFWNSDHVTVYDSFISGEYLGWNAKNLTLINCTIQSLQGLCYIDNLVMKNCKLLHTTLAFEYSTLQAEIDGSVDSVLNPSGGRITAESIGELILEKDCIDPGKTAIVVTNE